MEESKSNMILVNRNNLEMFIAILTQVHLRGQLAADEQAFLGKFVELPEAGTTPNRSQRRLNQKLIRDIFREEALKAKQKK